MLCVTAVTVREAAATVCNTATQMPRRRSPPRSASTPPYAAITTPGPRDASVITPTEAALPVSWSISQPAATNCIQLPTVVAVFAATSRRNAG